jgi:predicted nucleic acid-binding protein
MSILVDTNVLLRRIQPGHSQQAVAVESVARLVETREPVYFTLQNISEFWNVATRPVLSNGLGLSISRVQAELENIERYLELLPDSPEVYGEWKSLVFTHGVLGKKVHDAKLVATMKVHGVGRILTFDSGDFSRYNVAVIHPASLLS